MESVVQIPREVELIGPGAFCESWGFSRLLFESGSKLREIGPKAFSRCVSLLELDIPESVEEIGDEAFLGCSGLLAVNFVGGSKLRKLGRCAFAGCRLSSITIPASTEEMDGSAFLECPLIAVSVCPGSLHFSVQGFFLFRSGETEIVRYFGDEAEIIVSMQVEKLGKSCFESCNRIERIDFENGSRLKTIGAFALSNCESLMSIVIPPALEVIEEAALKGCNMLEDCSIDENAMLVVIENEAFAGCHSLTSFVVPRRVQAIGLNCFGECVCLHRLMFESAESLKKVVGDVALDDRLGSIGLGEISNAFRIKVNHPGGELEFPGWESVDYVSHVTLGRRLDLS
jgi:hypothetical protein